LFGNHHSYESRNTNDFGGGTVHRLRDFAHHPTIGGLAFSMLTQFTGNASLNNLCRHRLPSFFDHSQRSACISDGAVYKGDTKRKRQMYCRVAVYKTMQ